MFLKISGLDFLLFRDDCGFLLQRQRPRGQGGGEHLEAPELAQGDDEDAAVGARVLATSWAIIFTWSQLYYVSATSRFRFSALTVPKSIASLK